MIHIPRFAGEITRDVREEFLFFSKDFWIKDFLKYRRLFTNNDSDKGGHGSVERGPGGTQARREARCVPGSKPLSTGRDWRHARTGRQMTAAPSRAERSSARRPASTPRHVDSSPVYRISRSQTGSVNNQVTDNHDNLWDTFMCKRHVLYTVILRKNQTHHSSPFNKEPSYLM